MPPIFHKKVGGYIPRFKAQIQDIFQNSYENDSRSFTFTPHSTGLNSGHAMLDIWKELHSARLPVWLSGPPATRQSFGGTRWEKWRISAPESQRTASSG